MFNVLSRKEQEKYQKEKETEANSLFFKEYDELCKKHKRQFVAVLQANAQSLSAALQLVRCE